VSLSDGVVSDRPRTTRNPIFSLILQPTQGAYTPHSFTTTRRVPSGRKCPHFPWLYRLMASEHLLKILVLPVRPTYLHYLAYPEADQVTVLQRVSASTPKVSTTEVSTRCFRARILLIDLPNTSQKTCVNRGRKQEIS
jgi:hypothetical protein